MPKTLADLPEYANKPTRVLEFGDELTLIFRRPDYREWREFQEDMTTAKASDKAGKGILAAFEDLTKRTCISHTPDELEAIVVEFYDLYNVCADELSDFAKEGQNKFALKSGRKDNKGSKAKR